MDTYSNVSNIFGFNCTKCEYNRNCYGGNMGNQYKFCQKSREKLESLDKLEQENIKYKEVIDKIRKEINEEHSIMGVEVVENWVLKDILKEVE